MLQFLHRPWGLFSASSGFGNRNEECYQLNKISHEVSKVIVQTYEPWGTVEFTEPQDLDLLVEYLNGFRYTEVIPLDVNRSGTSAGLLRIIVSGEEKVFALEASALGLLVEGGYWYIAEDEYFQPLLDLVRARSNV